MQCFVPSLCVVVLLGLSNGEDHIHALNPWTYDDESTWNGACRDGEQQSPINIISSTALADDQETLIKGPLFFRGYRHVRIHGENNGHTVIWHVENGSSPTLSGGPLTGNYNLVQMHMHWVSEHAIDGYKFPLEMHFVHIKTGLSVEEALQRRDGLAVIGIFAEVDTEQHSEWAFAQLMDDIQTLVEPHAQAESTTIDFGPLLSPDPQSYYTYYGSLTTPTCDETVQWIVMDRPINISDNQYRTLNKVDVGSAMNFRTIRPLNDRQVYKSTKSCASSLLPSVLGTLSTLLYCTANFFFKYVSKGICYIKGLKKKLTGVQFGNCDAVIFL